MTTQWYAIILAGGVGERLWPLSTPEKPKQLLSINGKESLLEETILRARAAGFPLSNIGVVTTHLVEKPVRAHIENKVGFLLVEPARKNTAYAFLYALLKIQKMNPHAGVVFLPSDHFLPDYEKFKETLLKAMSESENNNTIATIGVVPTHPETQYGYIEPVAVLSESSPVQAIKRFIEKPNTQKAGELFQEGLCLWNIGLYAGKISVFLHEYQRLQPHIFEQLNEDNEAYGNIPSVSFDYAISEKSDRMAVVLSDMSWSDVGSMEQFAIITATQSWSLEKEKNSHNEKPL